jgi:hypothetical protein
VRRGDRITAIQRVAGVLAEKSWADAELTLQEFGVNLDDAREYEGLYEYAVAHVRKTDDTTLRELDGFLSGAEVTDPAEEERAWRAGSFRLFISHPSQEKERAGKLSHYLAPFGIEAFVAHNDVEPTEEWQDEIEKALLSCQALCAILTPDFVNSRWCDQEVGMVVAQRKLIIPLKPGGGSPRLHREVSSDHGRISRASVGRWGSSAACPD